MWRDGCDCKACCDIIYGCDSIYVYVVGAWYDSLFEINQRLVYDKIQLSQILYLFGGHPRLLSM